LLTALVSSQKGKRLVGSKSNQTNRDWPVCKTSAPAPLLWLPALQGRTVLGSAMDGEFEKQLARLEKTVAEILDAVKSLHHAQMARPADATEINARLRRFLQEKK
jgi:hypothetical protein